MNSDIIPVGEWLPDQPDHGRGATIVRNVLPNGDGYIPFPDFAAQSDALASSVLAAYSHIGSGGTVTTFAATATKIYKLAGTSWEDVTNTGGDYTTGDEQGWQFTQFGDRVIATNYADKIQSFLVGTDTDFSDLISSGPDVKCVNFGVINNFLVTINVNDADGQTKNRVRWSPINDPAGNWTSSQSTQADYQNVEDGNPADGLAVIGGQNYGLLIFRNAIHRMEYVGPPTIFRINLVEENRGAYNEHCVAADGRYVFTLNDNGFWLFDTVESRPIGNGKVDTTFSKDLDTARKHQIRVTPSPSQKAFIVSYPSVNSPDGANDKSIIYSYAYDRWSELDEGAQVVFRAFTSSVDLDTLASTYGDLETVPYVFDSRFWQGGDTVLGAFIGDQLGYYQGSPKTGYVATQEIRFNPTGRAFVDAVLPVYEGGDAMVRLGYRNLQNDTVSYTPYKDTSDVTGEVNFENESRYHRMEVKVSGDWEHFRGVRISAEAASGI